MSYDCPDAVSDVCEVLHNAGITRSAEIKLERVAPLVARAIQKTRIPRRITNAIAMDIRIAFTKGCSQEDARKANAEAFHCTFENVIWNIAGSLARLDPSFTEADQRKFAIRAYGPAPRSA